MAWVREERRVRPLSVGWYGVSVPVSLMHESEGWAGFDDDEAERLEARFRERYFAKLGWWKGDAGSPAVQASVRRFWMEREAAGVAWLLDRIRDETSVDAVAAVAEIAGDIGRSDPHAMEVCLDVLDNEPSEEQQDAAMTALRWMAKAKERGLRDRLQRAVERGLTDDREEVRERAILAARALPDDVADAIFAATREEASDGIREMIDHECVRRVDRA
jgi:hypothetical protein